MSDDGTDRQSVADRPIIFTDGAERERIESLNVLRQFDLARSMVDEILRSDRNFELRPSAILNLHKAALDQLDSFAGIYRPAGVGITNSHHEPIEAHLVAQAVESMCDYVNQKFNEKPPVHLAAFVLWRLNWIHPFNDANRRTARALSYLTPCASLGTQLPGHRSVPEQISDNKRPYYRALEDADAAYKQNESIDVSELENYLSTLLARQLVDVYKRANQTI